MPITPWLRTTGVTPAPISGGGAGGNATSQAPNITSATVNIGYYQGGFNQFVSISGTITLPTSSPLYANLRTISVIATDPSGNQFNVASTTGPWGGSTVNYSNQNAALIPQPTATQSWVISFLCYDTNGLQTTNPVNSTVTVSPSSLSSVSFSEIGPRTTSNTGSVSSTFQLIPVVASVGYPTPAAELPIWVTYRIDYDDGRGPQQVGQANLQTAGQAITWSAFVPTSVSQTNWIATICTGAIADNVALPSGFLTQTLTVAPVASPSQNDVNNAQFIAFPSGALLQYATNSIGQQTWWFNEVDWTQPTTAQDIGYWFSSITTQKGYAQTGSGTVSGGNTLTVGAAAFLQYAGTATVTAGGTGYSQGDVLILSGGTSTTSAAYLVTAVSSGVVTGVSLLYPGTYTAVPSNPISTTGGKGTGCTLTVSVWGNQAGVQAGTFSYASSASVGSGGSGYAVNDLIFVSGGYGIATAIFVVAAVSGTAVTSVTLGQPGTYSSVPVNPSLTSTNGNGVGLTLNVTWSSSSSGPGNDIHINGIHTQITGFTSGTVITFAPVSGISNGSCTYEIWNPAPDSEGANPGLAYGYVGRQMSDSGGLSGGLTVPGSTVALTMNASDAQRMPSAHNQDGTSYLYVTWRFRIYAASRLSSNSSGGGTLVLQTSCWSGADHYDINPASNSNSLDQKQTNLNSVTPQMGFNAGAQLGYLGIPVFSTTGSLPSLPSAFYPPGALAQVSAAVTSGGGYYQNKNNVWVSTQDPTQLLNGAIQSNTTIAATQITAGSLVAGVIYTGNLSATQINTGTLNVGAPTQAGQIYTWDNLGHTTGAFGFMPSPLWSGGPYYGAWCQNLWVGGTTGPAGALVNIQGSSGAITACTVDLTANGITTSINNNTFAGFPMGIRIDDGTNSAVMNSTFAGIYDDASGNPYVKLVGSSVTGAEIILWGTLGSVATQFTIGPNTTSSSPAGGSLTIPNARLFWTVNVGGTVYHIPLC